MHDARALDQQDGSARTAPSHVSAIGQDRRASPASEVFGTGVMAPSLRDSHGYPLAGVFII